MSVYALRDPEEKEHRRALLHVSHIAPLTQYVDHWRTVLGLDQAIPYFDPLDGGVNASLLLLLEAPGRMAVESGFISRDNPDPSARNMTELLIESDVARRATVLWNVVPWYVGDQQRIRPVHQRDIDKAIAPLSSLSPLLPKVRVVILVGRKAQRVWPIIEELFRTPVLACPHPSQRVLNVWPHKREEIKLVFQHAAQLALGMD